MNIYHYLISCIIMLIVFGCQKSSQSWHRKYRDMATGRFFRTIFDSTRCKAGCKPPRVSLTLSLDSEVLGVGMDLDGDG